MDFFGSMLKQKNTLKDVNDEMLAKLFDKIRRDIDVIWETFHFCSKTLVPSLLYLILINKYKRSLNTDMSMVKCYLQNGLEFDANFGNFRFGNFFLF